MGAGKWVRAIELSVCGDAAAGYMPAPGRRQQNVDCPDNRAA